MKKRILTILICGVMVLGLTGCGKSDVEDAKEDLQKTQEKYGWVEEENVETLVAKFNTQVMDNNNGSLNPAMNDYLTEDNSQYWYGLIEGISLVVIPKNYTGNKTNDIVDSMYIYVNKTTKYENDVITYAKHLTKANNENITDSEIDSLLKEAKEKSASKTTANNGKGISIGYLENNEMYQYQVIRLYK